MNITKLKQAEKAFLNRYPQGFNSPEMMEISKKHKVAKHVEFAQKNFAPDAMSDSEETAENMIRMVQRSSMVSIFEKPKFRDAVRGMGANERNLLAESLFELLHGDEAGGFHQMLELLAKHSLAKWTLITVYRCYYYPSTDFLYKPTTVKNVIKYFEIEDLIYKPRPYYDFYIRYRDELNYMKKQVDPSLSNYMAGFSGFLMMAMEMGK